MIFFLKKKNKDNSTAKRSYYCSQYPVISCWIYWQSCFHFHIFSYAGFRCACFHVFGKVVRHYCIPVCAEVCSTDGNLTKEAFDKSTFLMTNFQCSKWWLCSPFLSKFLAAPPRFYSISLLFQALIFLLLWTYKNPHTIHNI